MFDHFQMLLCPKNTNNKSAFINSWQPIICQWAGDVCEFVLCENNLIQARTEEKRCFIRINMVLDFAKTDKSEHFAVEMN